MKYSESVLSYKSEYKNMSDLVKNTDDVFFSKYFPGGTSSKRFSLPFIPGEIYSFTYNTDSKITKKRPFINRNPIVLCLDSYKNEKYGLILRGIDLLTIPPDIRMEVLTRIHDNFYSDIEKNEKSYSTGARPSPLALSDKNLNSLLIGTGYENSVFGFKVNFIRDPHILDLDDWYKLPYLRKNMVEGLDLQGIYSSYRSKLI